jgi:TfoX/Sxy family transcriptional regulator of competence genes
MPYNVELEQKIDRLLPPLGTFIKKKMFGGIGYLQNGNMVFGIHKQSFVLRTSPEQAGKLLKQDFVSVFDMTGRPMKGWLLISLEYFKTDKQLLDMMNLSLDYVKTLPGK